MSEPPGIEPTYLNLGLLMVLPFAIVARQVLSKEASLG